jgi:hypothetical protein
VPDKRKHRGPNPQDRRLFGESALPSLREAVAHLSWLLTRGYAGKSALALVGNRFELAQRQRMAVARAACSDADLQCRQNNQISPDQFSRLSNAELLIDGYNLITTVEVALAGGVILDCRDGCFRDIAGLHGTWRKVAETSPALALAADVLKDFPISSCLWYLDRPVSNSGRLKALILQFAAERGVPWRVELAYNPDEVLAQSENLIATSDSIILNRCRRWFNLARHVIEHSIPGAWIIPLRRDDS